MYFKKISKPSTLTRKRTQQVNIHTNSCIVCGGTKWLLLPSSHPNRSVRSDGAILSTPLEKAQCEGCGMIQSCELPSQKKMSKLYTDVYDIYNNRPGAEQFISGRYRALAQAITSSVAPMEPKYVLEVGCGNGAALKAISALWPNATCLGLEPVTTAVKAARSQGINVHQGMVGGMIPEAILMHKYDVIFSIHVIEHTLDPIVYLKGMKALLTPEGQLVVTTPNSRITNLEIMRPDHHYSMFPYHLNSIVRKAGLLPLKSSLCPGGGEDLDYEHNQLIVCCLPHATDRINQISQSMPIELNYENRKSLFIRRKRYFNDFAELDSLLLKELNNAKDIVCFGTGGWACMLAGYAPQTWTRVRACVIDGGSDSEFYGKQILPYEFLKLNKPEVVLIGTNPAIQHIIQRRLAADQIVSLRWDHIIAM